MTINALVVGCGSLYGKEISQQLQNNGYTVYGISGTESQDPNILKINWETCGIQDFEKFLRNLPQLDLVVFNQNSSALNNNYVKLNSIDIIEVWKRAKRWNQSHYVNCILPTHILHTLALTNKLADQTCIAWIVSRSMFGTSQHTPVDYAGQKYQNYNTMKILSLNNSQIFIALCPGELTDKNRSNKAIKLVNFLSNATDTYSGKLFLQNENDITEYWPG
jgi:hypothetical protein